MKQKQEIFTMLGGRVNFIRGDYNATSDAAWLAAFAKNLGNNVLDVGIGTGGVSLCLLHWNPGIKITGLDISDIMLGECEKNAKLNNQSIELIKSDILNWRTNRTFDSVVSNPPYFKGTGKKNAENTHHNADLYAWTSACMRRVRPRGYIYLIIDASQIPEVIAALVSGKAGEIELAPLLGKAQFAERILISARLGVKSPAKIYNPIFMDDKRILQGGLTISELRANITPTC